MTSADVGILAPITQYAARLWDGVWSGHLPSIVVFACVGCTCFLAGRALLEWLT